MAQIVKQQNRAALAPGLNRDHIVITPAPLPPSVEYLLRMLRRAPAANRPTWKNRKDTPAEVGP